MVNAVRLDIARLVLKQRWGALATLDSGAPLASMVAYAPERDLGGLLLFLSGLSVHTQNLLADPRASLAVSEPDSGTGDPQTLPRVSLQGAVTVVARESAGFGPAWGIYVERFPDAAPRLELGDFLLFRLAPAEARYVGGFARATRLSGEDLREAARALPR
jgi:putative heme iron utilization protein